MIELDKEIAHDASAGEMLEFLSGIQGNILRGHGRNIVVHIFVRFTKSEQEIRETLIPLARRVVPSARRQLEQALAFRESARKDSDGLFGSVLLSATGYEALGFRKRGPFEQSDHRYFSDGMRSDFSRAKLGDPELADWEPTFQERVDLLLTLAGDDEQTLGAEVKAVMGELEKIGVPSAERGTAIWQGDQPLEPFGFVDGISQPLFFSKDVDGTSRTPWDPIAPLNLVLIQDPGVRNEPAYGSFCVFRKLEQNVARFLERERTLAKTLNVDPDAVGASVVGRFRNGTPLHLAGQSSPAGDVNNFTFGGSQRCPLHSHMRKANPRRTKADRDRRIARRGIPYDHRPDGEGNDSHPEKGVGLLFSCFQASVDDQFAFIQRRWLNDPDFSAVQCGQDPLVGGGGGTQNWQNSQGKTEPHHFGRYVTMRGGEFFFAPSIAFLSKFAPP
jgi:Dyp-type peroxidase family